MPQNHNNGERAVLEHPDTIAIREHEITPLKARVDKCFSKENYAEFQKEVETIVDRTIRGESRATTKEVAKEAAKEFYSDHGWKQKTFWVPTLISAGLFVIAVLALFVKKG